MRGCLVRGELSLYRRPRIRGAVSCGQRCEKGKKAVLYALAQKGVDRELVESVLEEQEDARDEYELAKSAAFAKLGTPHRLDEKEYRRAAGFLTRKGFGPVPKSVGHWKNTKIPLTKNPEYSRRFRHMPRNYVQ